MPDEFEREPFRAGFEPSPEDLRHTRELVLFWADERRHDAHGLEGRAIGIARERYIVGDHSDDIPFFSERIRVTPNKPSADSFTDLYLYFPYDQLEGEKPPSSQFIFIRVINPEDVPISFVISKNKTAVFLSKDEMHVAFEHFDVRLMEAGTEEAITGGKKPPKFQVEHKILDELLSYLTNKQEYRITSQDISDVA